MSGLLCILRVGLILHWSVWMTFGTFGLPKIVFGWDYFFVFLVLSDTYIIFRIRTPYGLGMTKKERLGIPCPKNKIVWYVTWPREKINNMNK